ncbi:Rab3 GTPase-activating protein catalytic subunit-domain-containing protein [Mucor mucedo]|uniref:Rab3 GTPase-activating protein catalytic subunit-domain-containing protein n=1 Tax=Mucor mucedo TaxID=29922 RepID=UPI002220CFB2|nr:Rab3 GTPase-activating protein catalytic subunit-domain-containing protein [Mucor mucedo]KAI7868673.1 Rab3 GTPase-activating protein catalytic subunit-domain-containing protein [Mucor mucedo]
MSVTTPPSSQLSYLDGLKTLFLQKLCVHREEYGKSGDMIENFKVSAVYTYNLKNWFDENWKIWEDTKPVLKRKPSFSDDFESWGDDDEEDETESEKKGNIQLLYETEMHQLQFGSLNDPLRTLTLSALFPLSQDTLFDDAYQTNMDALTAKQWQISRELAPKSQQRAYLSTLLEQAIDSWVKDPSNKEYLAPYDDSNDESISDSISLMRNLFAPGGSHSMGSGDQQVNFFKSDQVDNVINALFDSMQSPIEEDKNDKKGFLSTKQLCLRLKTGSSVPYRSFLWNMMLYTLEEASLTSDNGKKQNASNFLGFLKIIWLEVLRKIRWHWENLVPIPDLNPYLYDSTLNLDQSNMLGIDLRYNILHQKISMVNCCIIRKLQNLPQNGNTKIYDTKPARHAGNLLDSISNAESDDSDVFLDAVEEESISSASKQDSASSSLIIPNNTMTESFVSLPYIPVSNSADELEAEAATIKEPELSEGQSHTHNTLRLLKTGEAMQVPITQDPGFMTEDMIHEQANVFESLGTSENATQQRAKLQSAQLYSDMQAFKAANPFACLEDFVRWHSPRDWIVDDSEEGGHLSARMSESSNIWQELWKCSRRIPCSRQKPLFNMSVEAEKGLYFLETTSVYEFFSM